MPATEELFPSKLQSSDFTAVFNFISDLDPLDFLAAGIVLPLVTATVYSGTDLSPNSIISGLPALTASDITQRITGGVQGVVYLLTCTTETDNGLILVRRGKLAVV